MRLLFTRFIPARAKLRFGRPYALCNSSCDNRISVSARACKEGSHVIALRYCFVEESIHEICHDNVSGRNCKLSLCKMLVLLRVDFSSGRGGGGANCEGISFNWTEWGRAAKRSMFLKQVNTG